MRNIFLIVISLFFLTSCSSVDTNYSYDRFVVASEKTLMPYDNGEWKEGYLVKRVDDPSKTFWSYFPYDIIDFEYSPGYEYLIYLRIFDVKDAEGNKIKEYRLHRLVSETKKESEDLPHYEIREYILASELRRKDSGNVAWYVAKSKSEAGELGEWDYLVEKEFMVDEIELGCEHDLKVHISNMSDENKSQEHDYYRVMEIKQLDSQSTDLPGYPMPSEPIE